MKKANAIAAAVLSAGVLLAVAGCSAGTAGNAAGHRDAPAKTYTQAEVSSILSSAQKQLGIAGTPETLAQAQASAKSAAGGSGLGSALSPGGITYSPAACGAMMKKVGAAAPIAGTAGSVVASGGGSVIGVATIPGKQLPSSAMSDASSRVNQVLSTCSSMKLSFDSDGQTVRIPMTAAKVPVSTDADSAIAVKTTTSFSAGGETSTSASTDISAVYGNLIITAQQVGSAGATAAPGPSPAQMVDAVVAAAKAAG